MTTGQLHVTPQDTIGDLLARHPAAARVLIEHHMHCIGCPIAPFETVAEACANYAVDVDELFADIRQASLGEDHI